MRFSLSVPSILYYLNHTSKPIRYRRYMTHVNAMLTREEPEKQYFVSPPNWYRAAYAKLIKLSSILQNVEQLDGRLIHTTNSTTITDAHAISHMSSFNSIAKSFISSQQIPCLSKSNGFQSITLNSLTMVAELLSLTTKQRKSVRNTILSQVTQHQIWRGTLLEVLKDVKRDIGLLKCQSNSSMVEQIVVTCIDFLTNTADAPSQGSPSWMKIAPVIKDEKKEVSHKWEEVIEMFVDLMKCIAQEHTMSYHLTKLEAMKDGLNQIRDVVIERDANYKEAWQRDCLIQWKLTKNLGGLSKCLFTLLLYYLFGSVRDIEVEVCGALHRNEKKMRFCVGKVLTSDNEEMVLNGVRQLCRVLGVFKFVWETAGGTSDHELELHGHLWCIGEREKVIKHRGYDILLHTIKP
ncbi:Exosome complex exonuclease RRP41 [Rhynchospora pubera]|uniref:Exosome complex exonuclease RRP41 n=1 Tax=Rhynchospora pubera TaxID=906938 RepID=A0AAV8DE95_9POAL|nr:Exosome complex exonuclease RRP41 [Rhynchospora pubera]